MAKVTLGTQKPQASVGRSLKLPSPRAPGSAGSWAVLQSTHVTAPMQGTRPVHQTQVQEAEDHAEASFNTGAGLFWVKEEMPFPGSPVFPKARGPGTVQCQMSSGPWNSPSSSAPPGIGGLGTGSCVQDAMEVHTHRSRVCLLWRPQVRLLDLSIQQGGPGPSPPNIRGSSLKCQRRCPKIFGEHQSPRASVASLQGNRDSRRPGTVRTP